MVGRVGQQNPDPAHCPTPERQQRRPVPIDTKSDFASIPPTHTLGGPAVNPQRPAKVGFCCPPPPGSGRAGWAAAPPIVKGDKVRRISDQYIKSAGMRGNVMKQQPQWGQVQTITAVQKRAGFVPRYQLDNGEDWIAHDRLNLVPDGACSV